MTTRKSSRKCPRPYALGKRREHVDQNRERVLEAARELLGNEGTPEFSLEAIAREAGVTRQTIHNQFGTRSELIEGLFDRMAMRGGIQGMAVAMQQPDPFVMLKKFIEVFAGFWSSDRLTIRRIHGLAVLDPELGKIDRARNERRRMAATRIIDALTRRFGRPAAEEKSDAVDLLFTATSFEFFDSLAGNRSPEDVCSLVLRVVTSSLGIPNP